MKHRLDVRVYYHDTDAGGVVYHGAYLDFAERGRTEFLRDMGHHHTELRAQHGMVFVVRKVDVDYVLPGFLDDVLVMESFVTEVKNSSFVMKQVLRRGDDVIAEMSVVLVCIDAEKMRPIKIPESLKEDLVKSLEE